MPEFSIDFVFKFLYQVTVGMVGLSFLVLIHEGGHFLVAKKFGVKVNTFAIGFGKTLFSYQGKETEYCFKAIPFGGYVAMQGEQPEEDYKPSPRDFSQKTIPQRIAIALGGPVTNIAFAFLILIVVFMIGWEEPISNEITVGLVLEDSPAQDAGILPGDVIVSFGGKPITNLEQYLSAVSVEAGNRKQIVVRRDGENQTLHITPEMHEMGFAMSGIIMGQTSVIFAQIMDEPAKSAGFMAGDTIVSAGGIPVSEYHTFSAIVDGSKGSEINVMVKRGDEELSMFVSPKINEEGKYRIGVSIRNIFTTPTHVVQRSFSESVAKSWQVNIQNSIVIFKTLKAILRGQVKLKALSGPVGILQIIGSSFRLGFQKFIHFLAMISLNLGLINLLPLIITDGGIIFFLCIEAIRKKPLSIRTQMKINQVAISLFITLALFITFHDILRIPQLLF